jgi:cellobiose phosphorylase
VLNYKYGYFSDDGKEFIITTPKTPRPWVNVISNGDYGLVISQTGSGYSWKTHAQLNRITRWEQDLIRDNWGKYIYLRDNLTGKFWSASFKPVCKTPEHYICKHGFGYTTIESLNEDILSKLTVFVPFDESVEIWKLNLINTSKTKKYIGVFTYLEWCLGVAPDWHREFHKSFIETNFNEDLNAIFAEKRLWDIPSDRGHWNTSWKYVAFHSVNLPVASFDCDKESFIGMYNDIENPIAITTGKCGNKFGNSYDAIASLNVNVEIDPGDEEVLIFTLGATDDVEKAKEIIKKYKLLCEVDKSLEEVKTKWDEILKPLQVETPDASLNVMINNWLKYQTISCRLWGRSAYYQIGGAYGFRDQLQDSLLFLYLNPEETKKEIILHAKHQFKDGRVYHWWHPITEVGLLNEISDNRLWLPFVLIKYIEETNDFSILDEKVPFVDDENPATIYEHCVKAIDFSLKKFSERGLPLIGGGDWNDGLNAVGLDGKGESIWLGHFLYKILTDFSYIAENIKDAERANYYKNRATTLKDSINKYGWDGKWYLRATKDNGEKIGSSENEEGKIFLNAQTWAVISGVADLNRANEVMSAVENYLECEIGPLLLYPAYKKPDKFIGYLTRYAPGARENGGLYTHAGTWSIIAFAILKNADAVYRIFKKINPANPEKNIDVYCAEPYVTPGNVEGPKSPLFGRAGWTWYTGSSAWLLRAVVDYILGVRATFKGLYVDPCIPSSWQSFKIKRTFRGAIYDIEILNPNGKNYGVSEVFVNGEKLINDKSSELTGVLLPLFERNTINKIKITL